MVLLATSPGDRPLWTLGAGLVAFAILPSLFAADAVRRRWERHCRGPRAEGLLHNVASALGLAFLLAAAHGPVPVVWDARGGLRILLLAMQAGAVTGLLWSLAGTDRRAFAGLRAPRANADALRLRTGGAYALCRHPLDFFRCLFFSAWPHMDARRLVFAPWLWADVWIGSIFEEQRLERAFGAASRRYQAVHPRSIPRSGR